MMIRRLALLLALALALAPAVRAASPYGSSHTTDPPAGDASQLVPSTNWVATNTAKSFNGRQGAITLLANDVRAALDGNSVTLGGTSSSTALASVFTKALRLGQGIITLSGGGGASQTNSFLFAGGSSLAGTCTSATCAAFYWVPQSNAANTGSSVVKLFDVDAQLNSGWSGSQSGVNSILTATVPPVGVIPTTVSTAQGSPSATVIVAAPSSGTIRQGQGVSVSPATFGAALPVAAGIYVQNVTGSGPYTVTLSAATTSALAAGTPITFIGSTSVGSASYVANNAVTPPSTDLVLSSTTLADGSPVQVGQTVFGPSIPTNTTVSAIAGNNVTLYPAVTGLTGAAPFAFGFGPPTTFQTATRNIANCNQSFGGVGGGVGVPYNYQGGCFAELLQARAPAGSGAAQAVVGQEIDLLLGDTLGALSRYGTRVVLDKADVARAVREDAAFAVTGAVTATGPLPAGDPSNNLVPGLSTGLMLGGYASPWPLAPTGSIVAAVPQQIGVTATGGMQAATGVDFGRVAFSGNAFASPGFSVSPSGVVSSGPLTLTPDGVGGATLAASLYTVTACALGGSGGSGYYNGDVVYTADGTACRLTVASQPGAATAAAIVAGIGGRAASAGASSNVATIGGNGAGATVNLTWTAPSHVVTLNDGSVTSASGSSAAGLPQRFGHILVATDDCGVPTDQVSDATAPLNACLTKGLPVYLPGGNPTTPASYTATVSGNAVASVTQVSAGAGYYLPPLVYLTGGGVGDGAVVTTNWTFTSQSITSLTVVAGGTNYIAGSIQITIVGGDCATPPVIGTPTITGGVLISVPLTTNGSNCPTPPHVEISPGTPASLSVTLPTSGGMPTGAVTIGRNAGGNIYNSTPTIVIVPQQFRYLLKTGPVVLPPGATLTGPSETEVALVLDKAVNTDVMRTANFYAAQNGNNSTVNALTGSVDNVILSGFTLDGNRSNQTATAHDQVNCLAAYGQRHTWTNLLMQNCAGSGIWTGFQNTGGGAANNIGVSRYSNIRIITTGQHGWRYSGPHDSAMRDITVQNACQDTDNTFAGFYQEAGNWQVNDHTHVWNTGTGTRCAWSFYLGGYVNLSHAIAEGGRQQIWSSGGVKLTDPRVFAQFPYANNAGSAAVVLTGGDNAIIGGKIKGWTPTESGPAASAAANGTASSTTITVSGVTGAIANGQTVWADGVQIAANTTVSNAAGNPTIILSQPLAVALTGQTIKFGGTSRNFTGVQLGTSSLAASRTQIVGAEFAEFDDAGAITLTNTTGGDYIQATGTSSGPGTSAGVIGTPGAHSMIRYYQSGTDVSETTIWKGALPTSSSGLASGSLWLNGNVVTAVP